MPTPSFSRIVDAVLALQSAVFKDSGKRWLYLLTPLIFKVCLLAPPWIVDQRIRLETFILRSYISVFMMKLQRQATTLDLAFEELFAGLRLSLTFNSISTPPAVDGFDQGEIEVQSTP
jgi:hypothetical protein